MEGKPLKDNPGNPGDNGWLEWKRKVLSDIERLGKRLDAAAGKIADFRADITILNDVRDDVRELTKTVNKLRDEITAIKMKLATYGAVGGAVAGIGATIITAFIMKALGL